MRTLAIGDIHGCHTALDRLLDRVGLESDDRVVVLGDCIDRGPGSRAVIDRLLQLSTQCQTVLVRGNHELMMLAAREDPFKANLWQSYGGQEALASYSAEHRADWPKAIPDSHWGFLESTVRFFETDDLIFVHACVDPELAMRDQPDWLLFWEFFDTMQPHRSGKRVICGHTPQRSGRIKDVGFALCVDTAAVSGGWLTCLDAGSGHYWQARETGDLREGILENRK